MGWVAGVDTGGTFTDLVLMDEASGRMRVHKTPSTPGDPSAAVFDAFEGAGVDVGEVEALAIGTTIATNAMLEREGARVVYVTTAGFEDVLHIQRGDKEDPYRLAWRRPRPFVQRRDCVGVHERVDAEGRVVRELAEAEVERVCDEVGARVAAAGGGCGIAINLLFAYLAPAHEQQLAAALRDALPDVPISVSHKVAPVWREYERGNTTVLDAYLHPAVHRLTVPLAARLAERRYGGSVSIMKSNGGQMTADAATGKPIQTVLSGLAGGIVAGRRFAELVGERGAITFDVGGTSADIGLIQDGEVRQVTQFEFEFGMPIATPSIDLVTIGAGGGSIAWVDAGGMLRVGPQSASAVPGPVCYGRGGTEPTVTDANLLLGRIDPAAFLGGRLTLDADAARRALETLGRRLGLSAIETARSVVEIANESMASAIRRVAIDRGADPRDFELVAFGGAGPLHACEVARSLGAKGVIVPPHPGLGSAFGTLSADRRVDRRWTRRSRSGEVDVRELSDRFAAETELALAELAAEGYTGEPLVLRSVAMRYEGQNYEREVPLPATDLTRESIDELLAAFHDLHAQFYGYSFPGEAVELVHYAVTAIGPTRQPAFPTLEPSDAAPSTTRRTIDFGALGAIEAAVVRRADLGGGASLDGPALVVEEDSTTLVPPGFRLRVDVSGILRLHQHAEVEVADDRGVDSVTMSMIGDQLVSITQEMGAHMMRSAYSPIFSESRDFSCALFDADGALIAQGPFNPAHLGAIGETVRCVLEELGVDGFREGDVVMHNDPYRGGCHLPEHTLLAPLFHEGARVGFAATIGHLAEIGAATVGSFVSDATEVFPEGLRIPPVHVVRGGVLAADVWRIVLANHRTPRDSWGDLHAMIGSLRVAERRVGEVVGRYGRTLFREVCRELLRHGERMIRERIAAIPDGDYPFEDMMEDDGVTDRPSRIRVNVSIRGDRAIVDYMATDPQARGPINATFGVARSATCNAFLQISDPGIPRNDGVYNWLKTIAPLGSVVNVRYPGPSVGGNTETQPKLVGMLLGALAPVLPERVMAAEGVTSCNFLFGESQPRGRRPYAHYHFEASGWGGRADGDGNDATNHIHGNCRTTPIEVFETRYPLRVGVYELVPDSGGAGEHRGGLAIRRTLQVLGDELTVSAMMDRVKEGAWGLFGGRSGRCARIAVRRAGERELVSFSEAFGTVSPSKFARIRLGRGDVVLLESAGGGGYGEPLLRDREHVRQDVREGFVSAAAARDAYGLADDEELAEEPSSASRERGAEVGGTAR